MSATTLASMQALQAALLAFHERMSAAMVRMNEDPRDGIARHEALLADFPELQAQAGRCLAELAADPDVRGGLPGFDCWIETELRRLPASIELSLAMGHYRVGDGEACALHLERYLAQSAGLADPARAMALEQLVQLDLDASRPDRAREHLDALDAEARHWTKAAAWAGVAPQGQEAESARQAVRHVVGALAMRADLALAEGDRTGYLRLTREALELAERAQAVDRLGVLWWARSSYELIWDATGERLDRAKVELKAGAPALVRAQPDFRRRLNQLLAHVWSERGKPDQALRLLQQALADCSPGEAAVAWSLRLDRAELLSAKGEHGAALREADLALEAARRLQSATVQRQCAERRRGLQLASGDPAVIAAALAELDAARSATEPAADTATRLQARVGLLLALKRHDEALRTLDVLALLPAAALALASVSPAVLAGMRAGVLRDAGRVREAAAVLEAAALALDADPGPAGSWRDWDRMRQTLCFGAALQHAQLGDALAAMRWSERGRALVWRAALQRHGIAADGFEPDVLRQRLTARRTALLCLVFGATRTAALVLPASGAAAWVRMLPVGEADWQRCFAEIERSEADWNPRFEANLATFSDWLGPLLSEAIEDADQLVVLPEGVAALVPFAGLTLPDGRALVDRVATVLCPTAGCCLRDVPATAPPWRLLSVGAGRSAEHDFDRMAVEIAEDAAGRQGVVAEALVDASPAALLARLPGCSALHLSVHGKVQPGRLDPLAASTLEFRAGEFLSARGFLERCPPDLDLGLVFLNACVSAGYAFDRSAGAGGFVQAMLEAGARQVVATLAYVDPGHAQSLALAFHRRVRDGAAAATALRGAQLERRSSGAPTSAWASHIAVAAGL